MRLLSAIFAMIVLTKAAPVITPMVMAQPPADTLRISLDQAETRFLDENLHLIAGRLELDIAEARVRQARLWDNPEVGIEHQIINRSGQGPVGFTSSDNTVIELEQTLFTLGKRTREIRLRELETMQTEHAFDVLLRSLRRDLRETWFMFEHATASAALYDDQIHALNLMLEAFEGQAAEGNVSRLEVLRIRGLLTGLLEARNALREERDEAELTLRGMLNLPAQPLAPVLSDRGYSSDRSDRAYNSDRGDRSYSSDRSDRGEDMNTLPDLTRLKEMALENRPDLRVSRSALAVSRQQLRTEQAAMRPDISLGLVYDRLDGPVDHYWGLMIGFEVPLFNRNQGQIQVARHEIRQHELGLRQHEQEVGLEVQRAVNDLMRAAQLLEETERDEPESFQAIMDVLLRQYREGNLSLIEFIDYQEAFREHQLRRLSTRTQWLLAIEALNFTTGSEVLRIP